MSLIQRHVYLPGSVRLQKSGGSKTVQALAATGKLNGTWDDYGESCDFYVEEAPEPVAAVAVTLTSRETLIVGCDSLLTVRSLEDVRPIYIKAAELKPGMLLQLPKRRIKLSNGTEGDVQAGADFMPVASVDYEDSLVTRSEAWRTAYLLTRLEVRERPEAGEDLAGLYLQALSYQEMAFNRTMAGMYGMLTYRHPNRLEIYTDPRRPSCFPSKLFSGLFYQNEKTALGVVEEFYGRELFKSPGRVSPRLLDKVWRTGIVFEGCPIDNCVKIDSVITGPKPVKMYKISLNGLETPLETCVASL